MSPHPLVLALENRFPGLFEISSEGSNGSDGEWPQLEARARSLSGDPGADLVAQLDFGEYSIGIGWLAHTHYDGGQLEEALGLLHGLVSGSVGCLDTLGQDGAPRSARMIDFNDAQSGNIPPLGPKDKRFRVRFFTGVGDMDGDA